MTVPEGLEPVARWGPHTSHWVDRNIYEKIEWVKAHIPDVGNALCAEFYVIDGKPVARVRYFARNAIYPGGPRALDPEPVIVPLAEMPPTHLLGQA